MCYALYASDEPDDVRYVGSTVKTLSNRLSSHLSDKKSSPKATWIAEVKARGARVEIKALSSHATEVELADAELHWIQYGGFTRLFNSGPVRRLIPSECLARLEKRRAIQEAALAEKRELRAQRAEMIGQRLVFAGQRIPTLVTVLDVREAFGRLDYQVQDVTGKTTWVNSQGCTEAPKEEKI